MHRRVIKSTNIHKIIVDQSTIHLVCPSMLRSRAGSGFVARFLFSSASTSSDVAKYWCFQESITDFECCEM